MAYLERREPEWSMTVERATGRPSGPAPEDEVL